MQRGRQSWILWISLCACSRWPCPSWRAVATETRRRGERQRVLVSGPSSAPDPKRVFGTLAIRGAKNLLLEGSTGIRGRRDPERAGTCTLVTGSRCTPADKLPACHFGPFPTLASARRTAVKVAHSCIRSLAPFTWALHCQLTSAAEH